jgi:hypothetical protein
MNAQQVLQVLFMFLQTSVWGVCYALAYLAISVPSFCTSVVPSVSCPCRLIRPPYPIINSENSKCLPYQVRRTIIQVVEALLLTGRGKEETKLMYVCLISFFKPSLKVELWKTVFRLFWKLVMFTCKVQNQLNGAGSFLKSRLSLMWDLRPSQRRRLRLKSPGMLQCLALEVQALRRLTVDWVQH